MDFHSSTGQIAFPSTSNPSFRSSGLQITLRQIFQFSQAIFEYLAQGDEPKISQRTHRSGQILWTIYDPQSNQRVTCSSEAEVRFWLEQRYSLR